jgi:hypothetical protein
VISKKLLFLSVIVQNGGRVGADVVLTTKTGMNCAVNSSKVHC